MDLMASAWLITPLQSDYDAGVLISNPRQMFLCSPFGVISQSTQRTPFGVGVLANAVAHLCRQRMVSTPMAQLVEIPPVPVGTVTAPVFGGHPRLRPILAAFRF